MSGERFRRERERERKQHRMHIIVPVQNTARVYGVIRTWMAVRSFPFTPISPTMLNNPVKMLNLRPLASRAMKKKKRKGTLSRSKYAASRLNSSEPLRNAGAFSVWPDRKLKSTNRKYTGGAYVLQSLALAYTRTHTRKLRAGLPLFQAARPLGTIKNGLLEGNNG